MKSTYLADKFLAKVVANEDFTVTNIYVGGVDEFITKHLTELTTAVSGPHAGRRVTEG